MKAWRYGRKTPLTKFVVITMVLVKIPVFYNMVQRKKLTVTTGNIFVGEVTKTGFTPCHSPLHNIKGKFYTSCIKEN
jgi:hypothetical protein